MWWFSSRPSARLTVLIPLHRALPWLDNISANIEWIPSDARIVISDETAEDNALDGLKRRHRRDLRITFRKKIIPSGWRLHANRLLASARTEFVAILAQDDRITPGFYEKLVAALDATPSAGVAFGPVEAEGLEGQPSTRFPGPPFPTATRPPWREAIELDRRWNLGIPYRGVVRRDVVQPIPSTPGDRFADQIWVFGLALTAHLIEVPDAVYIKRYHADNTHSDWTQLTPEERRTALEDQVRQRFENDLVTKNAALEVLAT